MGAINKRYAPHIVNYRETSIAPWRHENIWKSGAINGMGLAKTTVCVSKHTNRICASAATQQSESVKLRVV